MTPAEVLRAVNEASDTFLDQKHPAEIDLSDIPKGPFDGPAVRGKYAHIFRTFPLVEIDSDLHEAFPSATHVNDALRILLRLADETAALMTPASRRRRRKTPSNV
jgi:hypothetical protein